jgi:hypothetical protein
LYPFSTPFVLFRFPARRLLFTGDIQAGGLGTLKSSTSDHNSIMTYRVKFFGLLALQVIAAKGNKFRTALWLESVIPAKRLQSRRLDAPIWRVAPLGFVFFERGALFLVSL